MHAATEKGNSASTQIHVLTLSLLWAWAVIKKTQLRGQLDQGTSAEN